MNTRQKVIGLLDFHGIVMSSNELENTLFAYKQKYNNRFSGISLLFDMLDYEEELNKFIQFLNNRGDETQKNEKTNNI